MAVLKKEYLDETAEELRQLLELWARTKKYVHQAMSTEPLTREDENDFLRVKSEGTKFHRVLKNKLTDQSTRIKKLDFPYDKMIDILRSSISIAHLRSLPEADLKRILGEWHRINVQLNNVFGAYDFLRSDQVNLSKVAKRSGGGGGIGALFKNKKVLVGVLVAGGAAAAYFLTQ